MPRFDSQRQESHNDRDRNRDKKLDIFTVNDYIELFETCENKTEMYDRLLKRNNFDGVNEWKKLIPKDLMTASVDKLFWFWTDYCENNTNQVTEEVAKYCELFSLLENVFRNAILRPYIPAYCSINTNCGSYRFSEMKTREKLFRALKFNDEPKGYLTYKEEMPAETIVYALTCLVFWYILSKRLKNRY